MTPTSKITPAPKSGLVGDQRGAIVLMAVFMSAFLVGGLWYIMGIGDALVYRQTVQAGADSTAFTGAVYHARGMNIIAMVNIVIGAVVAIAAAAGFLMHIASMVISVATTMCELSQQPPITFTLPDGTTETIDYAQFAFACDTIKPAKDLMVKLQTVITKVKADTDSMLISLSTSQKEVARTAPWVGSAQSSVVADQHSPYLEGGGSGSPAMVPAGSRYGLPVQDAPFEETCNRGKTVLGKLVGLLVPAALDPILKYMNLDLAGDLPSKMCAGNGTGGNDHWDFFPKDDVCDEWWEHDRHGNEKKDKCEEDLEENDEPSQDVDLVGEIDPTDKSTKGIYDPAQNGNDYMQVYSFVKGKPAWLQRSDKGVEAPTWGGGTVAAPGTTFEDLGVAQAEFYYDQTPQAAATDGCWKHCPAGLTWNSYKENVLWNLRWRARLRRYRVPTEVDVNVLNGAIPDLADVEYSEGLAPFNAGVGMGPMLIDSDAAAKASNGASFIGSGPAIIH